MQDSQFYPLSRHLSLSIPSFFLALIEHTAQFSYLNMAHSAYSKRFTKGSMQRGQLTFPSKYLRMDWTDLF